MLIKATLKLKMNHKHKKAQQCIVQCTVKVRLSYWKKKEEKLFKKLWRRAWWRLIYCENIFQV
jgi:hypothetical protein